MKMQSASPIVPWIGGKRRLAKHILPLFVDHVCYVEPFAGAAGLFFSKQPSKVEVLNDVNGDLVSLYRVVQHHLDEFMRQFRWALTSRQMHVWLQETRPEALTDIQRAARFFYLQKLAFGGKVDGQHYGTSTTAPMRLNLLRLEEDLSATHLRLHQVNIENLDWQACIARYDREHTLFFCDPPYYGTAGYGVEFGLEQYEHMAELLRTMKGKAMVTVNDIPAMRKAFKGLTLKSLSIRYTLGKAGAGRQERGELLVMNY
jgi:DNA adenine methylase